MNVLIQQTLRESNGRGESRLSSFDWLYVANLRVTNRENVAVSRVLKQNSVLALDRHAVAKCRY